METFLKIMGDYGKTSNPDMLAAKFRGGNTGGPSEEVGKVRKWEPQEAKDFCPKE